MAKGNAGDRGHAITGKQLVTKVDGLEPELFGVNEAIKRALWLNNFDIGNSIEAAVDKLPANIIFSIKISDEVFASFKCSNGTVLSEGCRIGCGMTLNLGHGLGNRFWRCGVTDTPTCHGISLGETVYGDGEVIQVFT